MVKTGMPRAQIARFVRLRRMGDSTLAERRIMLEQHERALEEHMQELNQHMAALKEKIERLKEREAGSNVAQSIEPEEAYAEAY